MSRVTASGVNGRGYLIRGSSRISSQMVVFTISAARGGVTGFSSMSWIAGSSWLVPETEPDLCRFRMDGCGETERAIMVGKGLNNANRTSALSRQRISEYPVHVTVQLGVVFDGSLKVDRAK
jgi:hypothetical protein